MRSSYKVMGNYLYVKTTGHFALTAARSVLYEWADQARSHSLARVLWDISRLTGFDAQEEMSAVLRVEASRVVAKAVGAGFRLAILEAPRQLLEGGRIGEAFMTERGLSVKVTSDLEEALDWLGTDSADS